jgi:hypothetical protein
MRPSFESPPHLREQIMQDEQQSGKAMEVEAVMSHPKETQTWEPGKCIPQMTNAQRYVINLARVGENTQFMRDHTLLGIFLGLWPFEWDFMRWIKTWWNPKGDYELQLSSKRFFMIIFFNLEDKDRIFENGSYFFNSTGLYLRFWIDLFISEKIDFSFVPV